MKTYVIADTHFGDEFCASQRGFTSVDSMNAFLILEWNIKVSPEDKVYHLGDVAHDKKSLQLVLQLHGKKRLVRGNHDIMQTKDYINVGFKEIYASRKLGDIWLTHFPMHPDSLRYAWINVHGHVHDVESLGDRYRNVCCEYTGFEPVELEKIKLYEKEND